jgi:hypothetical protein
MRTLRSVLVLVLGLFATTSVFYAWQQQKALRTARLAAESLEKERAELRKKLWDSERRRNELESRARSAVAATESAETNPASVTVTDGATAVALPALPDGAMVGRLFSMLDNPEAQRLMAVQQRGALDARYSALFRMLNLPPEQLAKFKDLLVEKRTAVADVMAAARSQGLTGRENRDELRQLVNDTQAEIDANIRAAIGETAFTQYQNFEQTQPQRAVVSQLEQRLSYSGTPLTPQQSEQLVNVLAANAGDARQRVNIPPVRAAASGAVFTTPATLNDQALAQSATVLNPTQLQALQQLQQEQQAQAQLAQLLREQARARRGAAPSGNPGNSTPPPTATPPKG